MLALSQRIQYGGRGRCEVNDTLPVGKSAYEDAERAFNKQDASIWGDATVQSGVLSNMLACSAQPGAQYDELSRRRLRRCVEESPGAYDDEICQRRCH